MCQCSVVLGVLLILAVSCRQDSVCSGRDSKCEIPFLYNGHLHFECSSNSPVSGDLFGRCPTKLLSRKTREASLKASDWVRCSSTCPLSSYTSNHQIETHLQALAAEHPLLAQALHLGRSVHGQDILGIRITRGVGEERELLKPRVRYSGNMHGNEPVGREMLNHFAEVLLRGYGRDALITQLVDTTDITIIPTINPDGFDRAVEGKCSGEDFKSGRLNKEKVDINRDFPTWRDVNRSRDDLYRDRQPETKAMMDLILSEPWVIAANFHDGAVVAAYPYNDYRNGTQEGVHATPDDKFFKHLARTYADNHGTMANKTGCLRFEFDGGITNGADWYPLTGGMMDFSYIFSSCLEITLELSCCKYPSKYYLLREWERNRNSLLQLLLQAHRGVKGVLLDQSGQPIEAATVLVASSQGPVGKTVKTSRRGEFWKLLLPGEYRLSAELAGCQAEVLEFTVTEEKQLAILNITINTDCRPIETK